LCSATALAEPGASAILAVGDAGDRASAALPPEEPGETLLGPDGFLSDSGFYLGPNVGVTVIQGGAVAMGGVRGAWVMNRTFGLGFAGNALGANDVAFGSVDRDGSRRMRGGYGGLLLQYNIGEGRLLHGYVDTTLGGGALVYDSAPSRAGGPVSDTRGFLSAEPTVNLELNVSAFMRVAIGAGYRFALAEVSKGGPSGGDLAGPVARMNLEFGRF
jgi:hypothetical protein